MQPDLGITAKVSFVVNHLDMAENYLTVSENHYPDYESAKKAIPSSGHSWLWLTVIRGDGNNENSFKTKLETTGGQNFSEVASKVTRLSMQSDDLISLAGLEDAYPHITHISVQNPKVEDLCHLPGFKKLTHLEINNTFLKEKRDRLSQLKPQLKTALPFSDQTLEVLEKCEALTELTLTNVRTVSISALSALLKKMPQLKFQLNLDAKRPAPQLLAPCSDGEVIFRKLHTRYSDGKFSVHTELSRVFTPLNEAPDTVQGNVVVRVKMASREHVFDLMKLQKGEITPQKIQALLFDGDTAFFDFDVNKFTDASNLKEVTLCNATKKALQYFKKLTQSETLVVNNQAFKKSAEKIAQLNMCEKEDLEEIDDKAIFDLLEMKNLKKVILIGCEKVSDHMISYVKESKKGALTIERAESQPHVALDILANIAATNKAAEPLQKRDGKDEKEDTSSSSLSASALLALRSSSPSSSSSSSSHREAQSEDEIEATHTESSDTTAKETSKKSPPKGKRGKKAGETTVCYSMANDSYKRLDYKKTIEQCERFLELEKAEARASSDAKHFEIKADVLYIMASCHFALEKVTDKTKQHLEAAIKLFSEFKGRTGEKLKGKIWLLYGDLLVLNFNDHKKAASAYKAAQGTGLDDPLLNARSHYYYGICLQKTGGSIETIRDEFKQALRLINPVHTASYKEKENYLAEVEASLKEVNVSVTRNVAGHLSFEPIE